ncbi:MAG: hypothetical protein JRH20_06645 [Deltaproteobacteria bacterium]|nr:hypothetical protein [Deltaproteobacteria bacterium]
MGKKLDHSAPLRALGEAIAAAQEQALADGEQLAGVRRRLLCHELSAEESTEETLGRLGAHVGDTQQEVLMGQKHLHQVRARLLAPPSSPRSRGPLWAALALTGVSAAVLLATVMLGDEASLRYHIDGREGVVGAWIAPKAQKTAQMLFSDGSQIDLQARSNARVQRLDSRGAHVLLERGVAPAVVHMFCSSVAWRGSTLTLGGKLVGISPWGPSMWW